MRRIGASPLVYKWRDFYPRCADVYRKIGLTCICQLTVLAILGCASNAGKQPKMPPCVIDGQRGVWVSTNAGESYRCVRMVEFQNWWKWQNL
jgi:hypothetical protein